MTDSNEAMETCTRCGRIIASGEGAYSGGSLLCASCLAAARPASTARGWRSIAQVLAAVALVASLVYGAGGRSPSPARFAHDNAYGATANALEEIRSDVSAAREQLQTVAIIAAISGAAIVAAVLSIRGQK